MKTLPDAAPRRLLHTRQVTTDGFLRDDGLWDLEGELRDTKTYTSGSSGGTLRQPGEPIHHMRVRLTLDDDMRVHAAVAVMVNTPFEECQPAALTLEGLVGARIGIGWRHSVNQAMGGIAGCTHIRELLMAMATVAFQTIGPYRRQERMQKGEVTQHYPDDKPAHQMGQCMAWDFKGAVIARVAPQFIDWKPKKIES